MEADSGVERPQARDSEDGRPPALGEAARTAPRTSRGTLSQEHKCPLLQPPRVRSFVTRALGDRRPCQAPSGPGSVLCG